MDAEKDRLGLMVGTLPARETALLWIEHAERLRRALAFYADETNWTQPTGWGGRIFDDESEAIRDLGARARVALHASGPEASER